MPAYKYKTKRGIRWYFSVPYYNHIEKKKDRKVVRGFKTAKEAKEAEREFLNENDKYQNGDLTLSEIFEHRLENVEHSKATILNYKSRFKNHIEPYFGNKKIQAISLDDLQKFRLHLLNTIKSQNSAKSIYSVLELIYNHAAVYFKQDNLIKRIPTIKRVKYKNGYITLEEFYRRIEDMPNDVYKQIVIFQINIGLRISESLALQWKDVDFENRTIRVNKQVSVGNVIEHKLKTDESNAVIPFSDVIYEFLSSLYEKEKQGNKYFNQEYYIFGGIKHLYSDKVYNKFKKHFPDITVQDLRHSFATHLIKNDVSMPIVKELMRHSTIATTIDVYTHVADEDKRSALKRFKQ